MTSTEIIGQVGKRYLAQALATDDAEGTARFILDRLSAEQVAAVAHAVLDDEAMAPEVEIKLPAHFVAGQGLPQTALTEERATFHRHANCTKSALLLANTGDDEEQSLNLVMPIGAPQMSGHPEFWIQVASEGIALPEEQLPWWEKALRGLFDLNFRSLDQLACYVLETRRAMADEGHSLISALGFALPALQLPRDSDYFKALNEKHRGHASRWKTLYLSADKKRASYLRKLSPSQISLNADDLGRSFHKVKDSIREALHPTIDEFIQAPGGWNPPAVALSKCEWAEVEPLFSGLKPEKLNLGEATLQFYDERGMEQLTEGEVDYLNRLKERKVRDPEDEDRQFYEAHRNELKDDRKLKSLWDRFVFGTPQETDDFLLGLVRSMEALFNQKGPSLQRTLTIRCEHQSKKDFRELNVDAGVFFATRYRGLKELFGRRVEWKVGKLFEFPQLVEEWRQKPKYAPNRSVARAALQLKFVLELEVGTGDESSDKYSTQLLWKFDPNTVASEFAPDWSRLVQHPLVFCNTHREPVSGRGQFQSVDLSNAKTFSAAFDKDRGSFVSAYKTSNDVGALWRRNLSEAQSSGLISDDAGKELEAKFEAFSSIYLQAVTEFAERGLASDALLKQTSTYGQLLDTLCRRAKGDRSRELLLKPVLQIGTVSVFGGRRPAAIAAPWHPLRIAAMAIKSHRVADLLEHLLTAENIDFGDARLFFKELQQAFAHPFYPEVMLGWHGKKPELLALTDTMGDYTLHELPVVDPQGWEDTNENPAEASDRVAELVDRYLVLHPHEHANFSLVLYNCDSARLPQAVVDRLGTMHDDEEDVRCQIVLRHSDGKRLRSLYEKIIESLDTDVDSFNASEATKDFMARLRIGIMADQAPVPDPKDGCPADIVFSQDVIARHAQLEWYPVDAKPVPIETLLPSQWSRRRAAAMDDMKSVVYLCCPALSSEGWAYLTAITSFIRHDWDENESRRLLPARQLNFQDPEMARIFEETHNLGAWVVNYDELLDRRQLLNQMVHVIRYKQSATQGRNLIISSRAPLDLLRSMVLRRVRDLELGLSAADENALAERFIKDANNISGEIVLRAAKRGRNASELMGVVLSSFLIQQELGTERNYGWYFLDDYADWLGQREEQIADILALSPEVAPDGTLRLAVIISEAKYILFGSLSSKRKESQKQLLDTVRRISDALFGNPQRLDRDLWLSRFSDLVLQGIQFPANSPIDLSAWRRAIREGECEIYLRGYSHVFVPGPSDAPECSNFAAVPNVENCYQEVFSRPKLRQLVLHYWRNTQPLAVRQEVAQESGEADVWSEETYRKPSETLKVSVKPRKRRPKPKDDDGDNAASAAPVGPPPPAPPQPQAAKPTTAPPAGEQGASPSWAFPGIAELINSFQGAAANNAADLAWLKQTESLCKAALQHFQLHSKLLSSVLTPNAAILKFQGSADLTVEQVLKRRSEFLTSHKLNVLSVRGEAGAVAISVARPHREVLQLPEVWKRWNPQCTEGNYELLIAVREEDSSLLFLSPRANAPHTLIAGSTGSGKSVLMQNIILAIAATNRPEQARITLIDPKQGVDYFAFEGLPHLEGGVIDDQQAAIVKLNEMIVEMERRYTVLKQNKVANIFDLNGKANATERLPFLWVIHDEFADWMMTDEYRDAVTDVVGRLGAKARAAGISLVFAAQRPDANVMPMQLRANLGNRLILRVDGEGTSEIALSEKGAERLLGKGHLAAKLEGEPSIIFAQVPFVTAETLGQLVSGLR